MDDLGAPESIHGDGNPAMKRRTKGVLLVGGLAVAAVATYVVLSTALTRALDPDHQCETGFSTLVSCTLQWSSKRVSQSTPDIHFPVELGSQHMFKPGYVDATSWAIAQCPENDIAKRLLCAVGPAQAASDDRVTGLPLPKPWVLRTAKESPFIKSLHLETPIDLAAVLGFYRAALSERGWTEKDGAVVEPDRAVIAFTTADGPALLRLIRQADTTIADLSLRRPGSVELADILPKPGQVRLLLGNATDEEAVVTINEQTIELAARADVSNSPEIDLPQGKLKVIFKVASGRTQSQAFEVGADETWGLLAGPDGVPLPVRLY